MKCAVMEVCGLAICENQTAYKELLPQHYEGLLRSVVSVGAQYMDELHTLALSGLFITMTGDEELRPP